MTDVGLRRERGIMSAQVSPETESHLSVRTGSSSVDLFAWELNAAAPPDIVERLRALPADGDAGPFKVESLALAHGGRAWRLSPSEITTTEEANYVRGAVVEHPDGSLQWIAHYAGLGAKVTPGLASRMDQSLSTLRAERRARDLAGSTRKLGVDAGLSLAIELPPGFVIEEQSASDFALFRIKQIVPFGSRGVTGGIYVGHHPRPPPERRGLERKKLMVAGKKIDWLIEKTKEGVVAEGRFDLVATDAVVHIFASAPPGGDVAMVEKMLASMRELNEEGEPAPACDERASRPRRSPK